MVAAAEPCGTTPAPWEAGKYVLVGPPDTKADSKAASASRVTAVRLKIASLSGDGWRITAIQDISNEDVARLSPHGGAAGPADDERSLIRTD
jgi:hypothetical protein